MQWDIEQLFHEVVDLKSEERAAHFQSRQVPPEVREELEGLLRHDAGPHSDFPVEPLGEACGPYRLIRKLGSGGMASVYLARRADGEIDHNVAIKLLRHGTDAPWLIGRFLRERQILASLRHPGIAQLLDAGHTSSGQPYLVMEYVDGTPIDQFCEHLPLRKKIEMALQVCDAVAYAHRNLVIHRDLKPSNILVDASGHAKLLDFGIAKILHAASEVTLTRERMMTPEYASPEQVRGGPQTTATDVYLMGAVLYRLLTGSSPHTFASPEESIDFVVCAKQPKAASQVRAGIPEDLDAILAMALRKEPEARYASIEALMEDLRAFLSWRPVRARSGDKWYRTRRFLRRYWVPLTAALVAVAGLTTGLLLANHQRAVAQRRFLLVRHMASRFFTLDRDLSQLTGSTQVRHKLVSTSLQYLSALEQEAGADPELAMELASAYVQMATVQGVPIGPNLGEPAAADAGMRRASALLEPILRRNPRDKAAMVLAAVINESRMILAENDRRSAEAHAFATEATRMAEAVMAMEGLTKQESADAARVLLNAGLNRLNAHRYDEGIRIIRLAAAHSRHTGAALYEGQALSLLANALRLQGNLEEALQTIHEAKTIVYGAKFPTAHHRQMALYGVYWREGMILGKAGGVSLGRRTEAIRAFEQAMDLALQAAVNDRNDADARIRVGTAARELGQLLLPSDPRRALLVFDQGLQALAEAKPTTKTKISTLHLLAWSSHPLRALNRFPEARQRVARAFLLAKDTNRYPKKAIGPGTEAADLLLASAEQEAAAGNNKRAADIYQELVNKSTAAKAEPEADLANASTISLYYARLAQLTAGEESAQWVTRRAELWTNWQRKLPGNPFITAQVMAVSAK